MSADMFSILILFVFSFGITFIVFYLVQKSHRNLLNEVVQLPACTTFYSRILLISLILIAASTVLDEPYLLKGKEPAFMEYVWNVASGLADVIRHIFMFFIAYLIILTILVAVLRKRNE